MAWLDMHDVVQRLLAKHLHQRQYVEQVRKVLRTLAPEAGLRPAHIDLLWSLTEKVQYFGAFSRYWDTLSIG